MLAPSRTCVSGLIACSRDRYRKAAEMSKVRGKFSCLLINDLDAGIGHFKDTQVTVNNQVRAVPFAKFSSSC